VVGVGDGGAAPLLVKFVGCITCIEDAGVKTLDVSDLTTISSFGITGGYVKSMYTIFV
jgi:hypothetical protein